MKILLKIIQTIGWDKIVFVPPFLEGKSCDFFRKLLKQKACIYTKSGLSLFLDVEKSVVCVNSSILFVRRVIKITIREVTLHIMKSDVLVSVPIQFLFSDSEQNSFVRQRIHI